MTPAQLAKLADDADAIQGATCQIGELILAKASFGTHHAVVCIGYEGRKRVFGRVSYRYGTPGHLELDLHDVAVAEVGVARATPDWAALQVMNAILGGKFSSRLNLSLREKHAYTYGASSGFDMRHGAGPFRAGGEIVREHTVEAVQEILAELSRIRSEPVSDEELTDAKGALIDALPARFETAGETAGALAQLAIHGLPLDEYATRAARLSAVTATDVLRVAHEHLRPERMRVVLVGDVAAFREKLAALGLGEPLVADLPR